MGDKQVPYLAKREPPFSIYADRLAMEELVYKFAGNDQELKGVHTVRRQVFVEEQEIPVDIVFTEDKRNDEMNIVAKVKEIVIGTIKVQIIDNNTAKLERMAILKRFRGKGIGRGIISFVHEQLQYRNIKFVFLHAQQPVIDFYKSCGFSEIGSPFFEAGIKHVKMEMHY
ncbi:GNAT family N-acetyltransferase [Chloroflexota bacterium]